MKNFNPFSIFFAGKKRRIKDMTAAVEAMKSSEKDLAFIVRFNEETFFKSIDISVFGGNFLCLKDKRDIIAFTALYSMTFFELRLEDIFGIDEVFEFSERGIRSKDDKKRQAAEELTKQLKENVPMISALKKMASVLIDMPFPPLNTKNPVFTAQNYVLYWGAASIGSAFLKAVINNISFSNKLGENYLEAAKKAEILSDYQSIVSLCREIPTLFSRSSYRIESAPSFKAAENLQQTVKEEESADT